MTSPRMRRLATKRLILEPQVAAHSAEMFRVLRDPALYEFENAPPTSVEVLHERFTRLESRRSPDGSQQWLNWVIRSRRGGLIGFAQATVFPDRTAGIAYVLSSAFWGQGLASEAVIAMGDELCAHYDVARFSAVLKRANARSVRLLERLGFRLAADQRIRDAGLEAGEILMLREGDTTFAPNRQAGSHRK